MSQVMYLMVPFVPPSCQIHANIALSILKSMLWRVVWPGLSRPDQLGWLLAGAWNAMLGYRGVQSGRCWQSVVPARQPWSIWAYGRDIGTCAGMLFAC
jgi:hypothetical protein